MNRTLAITRVFRFEWSLWKVQVNAGHLRGEELSLPSIAISAPYVPSRHSIQQKLQGKQPICPAKRYNACPGEDLSISLKMQRLSFERAIRNLSRLMSDTCETRASPDK